MTKLDIMAYINAKAITNDVTKSVEAKHRAALMMLKLEVAYPGIKSAVM